jgi:ATP adenylyltransferase
MAQTGCIFCDAIQNVDQNDSLVLFRGKNNFILLNRYPYNNGHLMIAPFEHLASPADVKPEVAEELIRLTQRVLKALREVYHPDGFNIGMNLGRYAGAGVEDHYHLHIVPRWDGDTNFMTAIAETRVIPEDFSDTISKLKPYFKEK